MQISKEKTGMNNPNYGIAYLNYGFLIWLYFFKNEFFTFVRE
ncbi:hypothetical protein AQPE_1598 [Aquipluma nitroreducens]|uniref:Uncharacterized protein n=1 Tax=Aquipluma nitroreducens TaxID=2010828 RepID=A0A5K7S7A3_9BACT|nr:hypothetical protein AQPE_1598 [Aquipluma nitroreducens]